MNAANRPLYEGVWEALELRSGLSVLEIGFGNGLFMDDLSHRASGLVLHGLDFSEEMVKEATARNRKLIASGALTLQHGASDHLPFADAAFDPGSLHQRRVFLGEPCPPPQRGLRVLRPQGTFTAVLRTRSAREKLPFIRSGFTMYEQADLEEVLRKAGFRMVSVTVLKEPEIDRDDFFDIMVTLIHGQPPVDAPNVARLRLIDDDLELCADGVPFQSRPRYYEDGRPLDCSGGFDWQADGITTLGDFGSFTAIGPMIIDSQYVAFRRGEQTGWILLSFDLTGQAPWLEVHRALSICGGPTHVLSPASGPTLALHPDPSDGQPIRVECSLAVVRVELLDATGRPLAQFGAATRTIPAPEKAGTYFVRVTDAEGRSALARMVRY